MKSLNAIRVFLAPALSLMNMLLNGCETENCNSLLRTEFVLFRVHALASCSSSNEALYSDKSILWSWSHFFFHQNLLHRWRKRLHGWSYHRGICASDAVLSDFCFALWGAKGSVFVSPHLEFTGNTEKQV